MGKKKTYEEVYNDFLDNGYILLEDNYKNNRTKMKCMDKLGYKYFITYGGIHYKSEKVSIHNPFSDENIQLFLKHNDTQTILLNHYQHEKSELILKCQCGIVYKTHWNHLSNKNNLVCPSCANSIAHSKHRLNVDDINQIVQQNNFKLLKYNDRLHIEVEDNDGYRYVTSIYNINDYNRKSSRFNKLNPFTKFNMNVYIKKYNIPVNIKFENIKNKFNVRYTYLPCECIECGNIFYATWSQIISNNRYRCEKCVKKQSSLETIVKEYLIENNIKFTQQHRFVGCKIKRCLPFDFYLTDYNCAIEVQGRQHYYEQKNYSRTLERQKEYDNFKKQYCYLNDIIFIELPYWDIKNGNYKHTINNIIGWD